jgi:hypothetical protein
LLVDLLALLRGSYLETGLLHRGVAEHHDRPGHLADLVLALCPRHVDV